MSGIAGVLRREFTVETTGEYDATAVWATPEEIIEALAAAGFGLLSDAKAEAWDEGQRAWEDELLSKTAGVNPYRAVISRGGE